MTDEHDCEREDRWYCERAMQWCSCDTRRKKLCACDRWDALKREREEKARDERKTLPSSD